MGSIKSKIRVHTLVLGQVFFFARFKLQQWFRCWEQILVVVAEIVVERCSFLHLQPHKNNKKKHTTFEKFLVCSAHDIYIYRNQWDWGFQTYIKGRALNFLGYQNTCSIEWIFIWDWKLVAQTGFEPGTFHLPSLYTSSLLHIIWYMMAFLIR